MNKALKTLIGILSFALIIALASIGYKLLSNRIEPESNIGLSEGEGTISDEDKKDKQQAPDFTMDDSEGNEIKLSDMKGKPIVLNFWASWCPPCKREMPEFNKVFLELGDEIQFMMVDLADGQRETKEKGEEYIRQQGFSFPVFFDTKQEGAYTYGIKSIPTTLFIDKDGYIITGAQGAIGEKTLRKGIDLIK